MTVIVGRVASKLFDHLDARTQERIMQALEGLGEDPPVGDIKKLKGAAHTYRLRVGDYRIFYNITKDGIFVGSISIRGQAYKKGK